MWIDVTANQRLAQGTTPIAGPRQQLGGRVAADVIPTRQHLLRHTAKADLQHLDRSVAASVLFRQRTQVDMKSSCD